MGSGHGPEEGSIAEQVTVLADLQRKGLIRHIGLSNVTASQVAEAKAITDIVCVQNNYNLAYRHDDILIDDLARQGIAYVPFFPLGGFAPAAVRRAQRSRRVAESETDAGCAGVAASSRAKHPAHSWHIIVSPSARKSGGGVDGTSSRNDRYQGIGLQIAKDLVAHGLLAALAHSRERRELLRLPGSFRECSPLRAAPGRQHE
jgi:hypothetical protein